ncbi:lipoyl(octanoyl) transferase LipB [Reinekea thalattae]|uniref:Octanoyltransferase n=1 Tax=Reinekea thalattae TaxID=2593301 RepID=A0A5C8Z815_9GAMM|nr:lipoyl(octanoyl) transferase LipB [Reinekea thalattae]
MLSSPVVIRYLGQVPYLDTWHRMQDFTANRSSDTRDEIWLLEHEPVFTQGQSGKPEHLLNTGDIPVVNVDRGGQVTYHGPGQMIAYVLLDMKRVDSDVRKLVNALENSIIATLGSFDIQSGAKKDAPGVYVSGNKICSLGLRIKHGKSFHGLALNVNMDLEPFLRINPCGYAGLEMAQVSDFVADPDMTLVMQRWVSAFCTILGLEPLWES